MDREVDPAQADAGLNDLVAKSLVAALANGHGAAWRLLDTARDYASRKLDGSGECKQVATRHARHLLAVLGGAEPDWEGMTRRDWLARYAPWIACCSALIIV